MYTLSSLHYVELFVQASEDTSRTIAFGSLEGARNSCLLGKATRRRLVPPCPAVPHRPAVYRPSRPTRGMFRFWNRQIYQKEIRRRRSTGYQLGAKKRRSSCEQTAYEPHGNRLQYRVPPSGLHWISFLVLLKRIPIYLVSRKSKRDAIPYVRTPLRAASVPLSSEVISGALLCRFASSVSCFLDTWIHIQ